MQQFPSALNVLSPRPFLNTGVGRPAEDSLDNVNTAKLPDGSLCWVLSLKTLYQLDKSASGTETFPNVINAAGGGQWKAVTGTQAGALGTTFLDPGEANFTRWVNNGGTIEEGWWFLNAAGVFSQQRTATGGDFDTLYWQLPYAPGRQLTNATVTIQPNGGHAALPSTVPQWRVQRRLPTTNSLGAPQAFINDPSADVPTYETQHTLVLDDSVSGMPVTFESGYLYLLSLSPEAGTNSLAGLQVFSAQITIE